MTSKGYKKSQMFHVGLRGPTDLGSKFSSATHSDLASVFSFCEMGHRNACLTRWG